MSDKNTQIAVSQIPAHLPASELLAMLRERRAAIYSAVEIATPFGVAVELNGKMGVLPMGGWTLVKRDGDGKYSVVLDGIGEEDARRRAEILNTATAPTGEHRWN